MPGLEKRTLVEFTHTTPEKLHARDLNVRKKTCLELVSYHEILFHPWKKKGLISSSDYIFIQVRASFSKKSYYRNM